MDKREINYRAFLPMGLCFVGAGVVFMAAVNAGLGTAFIGLGIVWIAIALSKQKDTTKNNETDS